MSDHESLLVVAPVDLIRSPCSAFIEAGEEVFNSYGQLSSAHLACEYGFIPEEAGTLAEDRVHFDSSGSAFSSSSRCIGDSLFAAQPHPLVESSVVSEKLPPDDRFYISPDGQLSEHLFLMLAERAGFEDAQTAVGALFDAGEFQHDDWERLQRAVVSAIDTKLAAFVEQERLFGLLEVRQPSLICPSHCP